MNAQSSPTTEGGVVVPMSDFWIPKALEALDAARSGQCPPLEFLPMENGRAPRWTERADALSPGSPAQSLHLRPAPKVHTSHRRSGPAVVVRTSGSTGVPKQTLLPWEALEASAEMTADALGGHGQWLLTLQPSYVAGLAVLTRSLVANSEPIPLLEGTTNARLFTEAAERLTGERRYVSLVPTQLQKLLDWVPSSVPPDGTHDRPAENIATSGEAASSAASEDGLTPHTPAEDRGIGERLLAALRRFDAILLGGGPTHPVLFDRARQLGLSVIRTYGMAETCGGCVYDGHPLPDVSITVGAHGRVVISGPMVALGYLDDPELSAEKFGTDPATGHRRFRTDDLGELKTVTTSEVDSIAQVTGAGYSAQIVPALSVTGRADDVIITGGVKVSAQQVRQALEAHPSVREAYVAGVEDAEWGQKVTAAVVLAGASREGNAFDEIDQAVREQLGAPAVPKHYELLGSLPLLPNGKPDRQALLDLLTFGGP
ncbi:AMP-binding enzyme [Nesterenkonia muleiensis]|uniref:AMP-binding enzyme n=1 Tax=Nesterenkonia muleiensis TaxID=2282648 RepID=UPI000E719E3F|nr:AMP-binding protein [Nesterenkonia muleiensis]